MMEPIPSADMAEGENRITSLVPFGVPCITSSICAAWHSCNGVVSLQSIADLCEDSIENSRKGDDQNKDDASRSLAAPYTAYSDPEDTAPYETLTIQALHQHNLRHQNKFQQQGSQHTSLNGHMTVQRDVVFKHNDTPHRPISEYRSYLFNSSPYNPAYTRHLHCSTDSMYNQPDHQDPKYQCPIEWQTQLGYRDSAMDILVLDTDSTDIQSLHAYPFQELNTSSNDLVGVGEHLEGNTDQLYVHNDEIDADLFTSDETEE